MFKKLPNYEKPLDLYRFVLGLVLLQRQTRPRKPANTYDCYLHCPCLTDVKKLRKFGDLWSGGKSKAHSRLFERGTRWSHQGLLFFTWKPSSRELASETNSWLYVEQNLKDFVICLPTEAWFRWSVAARIVFPFVARTPPFIGTTEVSMFFK